MAIDPGTAMLAGAGISAGANLLGGVLGSSANKKAIKEQRRMFNAQMDQSIQRRVADAKKAGVHPLFALGASVGASPTSTIAGSAMGEGLAAAGDAVGQGISNYGLSKQQKAAFDLQVRTVEAQVNADNAQAAYYDALAAKTRQDLNATGKDSFFKTYPAPGAVPGMADSGFGAVEYVMPIHQTHQPGKPGTEAGRAPAMRELQTDDGLVYRIYSESAQADELNQALLIWQSLGHSVTRFKNWARKKGYWVDRPGDNPFAIRIEKKKGKPKEASK